MNGKHQVNIMGSFRRYEKKIASYIGTRKSHYFSSRCFEVLKNRVERLRSSIDTRFHKSKSSNRLVNDFKMKLGVPLVRESFLAQRASLFANFKADPLVSLSPIGADTPYENARHTQDMLTSNFRRTKYRRKGFNSTINLFSRYGAAVSTCYWRQSNISTMQTQAMSLPDGRTYGYERVAKPRRQAGVENRSIYLLNYFQNPTVSDPEESDYQGHIERWRLSDLIAEVSENPDAYVKDNAQKVIKEAKNSSVTKDTNYFDFSKNTEWQGTGVDITHWWGTLNINGNERDRTTYYVEMVGETIIRIQENPNDGDIRPYSTFAMDKREEYWWGNSTCEFQIPFENAATVFLNMQADAGMRALQSFVFFDRANGLDPSILNQAAKTGGFVGLDLKRGQEIGKALYPWQRQEISGMATSHAMNEIKEASQRVKPKADFTRNATQGGPQNKTATAAIAMTEQGDIAENYYFTQFEYGLMDMTEKNVRMLQTFLPDQFSIRPKPQMAQELTKGDILGDFDYMVSSTLSKNRQIQSMNLINTLTAMMNFKGSQDPSWQNVNMAPIIEAWIREIDLPVDVDKVIPDDQTMMGMGGGMPQVMGGAPPAPPAAPQAMGAPSAMAMG